MAISRPLLLTLIAAVLAVGTFYAVTSARDAGTGESTAVEPASQTPAPAARPASAKLSAAEVVKAATQAPPVKSGRFEATLRVTGAEAGTISVSGAFQLAGPADMPKLDVRVRTEGDGEDVDAGFVSTGDKGYVISDGTAYELPEDAWTQAVQARAGQQAQAAPGTPAALGLDPASWVRDVKDEGTETIDGVETRHVSATVDARAALRELAKLGAPALPAGTAERVRDAKLEAWVGNDDRIVRRLTGGVTVSGETISFDVDLTEVNDPQTIEAPEKVGDVLPGGISSLLTRGIGAATGVPVKDVELPRNNHPQRLDRAVAKRKPAVLFFRQPRGLDDAATAAAVRTLDRRTNLLVLTDDVRNADRYGQLVEDLGVTQAPSIVIVDKAGKARLIEGYVDSQSLLQDVADLR